MIAQAARTAQIDPAMVSPQPVISILGIDDRIVSTVAVLLRAGFSVICADSDTDKVDTLTQRIALGIGTAMMATLRLGQAEGNLLVTDDIFAAVAESDITFICQGPGEDFRGEETTYALTAMGRTIGAAIALKPGFHIVVQQAATVPGITRRVLIPAIEAASGLQSGLGFGLCHSSGALAASGMHGADSQDAALLGVTDRRSALCLDTLMGRIGKRSLIASIELSEMASQTPSAPEETAAQPAPCGASIRHHDGIADTAAARPGRVSSADRKSSWGGLFAGKPLWTHDLALAF